MMIKIVTEYLTMPSLMIFVYIVLIDENNIKVKRKRKKIVHPS